MSIKRAALDRGPRAVWDEREKPRPGGGPRRQAFGTRLILCYTAAISKADRLKEEPGWLKLFFGAFVAMLEDC